MNTNIKDLKVPTLDERLDKVESLLAEFRKNQDESQERRDAEMQRLIDLAEQSLPKHMRNKNT